MSEEKNKAAMQAKEFIQKFFDMITDSNLSTIKKFVKNFKSEEKINDAFNHTKEGRGRMAIHFAAARGDKDIFNYVYDLTENKFVKDNEGTPFI